MMRTKCMHFSILSPNQFIALLAFARFIARLTTMHPTNKKAKKINERMRNNDDRMYI